ncbi:toluene tolerance protein [Stutzerimonas kunmingensis]|uniref:toluene tolerance protein n=1 Tax=Stutzerimonas kunmingensis TaxID=1211807 RepID=UPI0028B017E0|nr:toluene tolerance protein [Stutzerimonas kunmingensis]
MRIVTAQELESWLASGKVLEQDTRGPKVAALENGLFLKIFHTRRHPVLARLWPSASRFQRNTMRLRQIGIAAPNVVDVFWLDASRGLSGCLYTPLPGESIESLHTRSPSETRALLPALAAFVRTLHHQGIYFRSLHLGNILYLGHSNFGLIDVLDMQFKRRPLSRWLVRRNLAHLEKHLHRHKVSGFPLEILLESYDRS